MEFIHASVANRIATEEIEKQTSLVSSFTEKVSQLINDKIEEASNGGLYGTNVNFSEDDFIEEFKNISEDGIPFILQNILDELEAYGYDAQFGFTPSTRSRSLNGISTPWSAEFRIQWRNNCFET